MSKSEAAGIHGAVQEITTLKPKHVWLSPVCGPYSVMQNINQRTPEQREALAEKRREALKQYVGCCLIYRFCIQSGIHVTWGWSRSCLGWRLPIIQGLIRKYQPYFALISPISLLSGDAKLVWLLNLGILCQKGGV